MLSALIAAAAVSAAAAQDAPKEHLAVMEPLIGKWVYEGPAKEEIPGLVAQGAKMEVIDEYVWSMSGKAILHHVVLRTGGQTAFELTSLIGWDAKREQITEGGFTSPGGTLHNDWNVSGNKIIVSNRGVEPDGTESSATNIFELTGPNAFTWKSTKRVRDGESLPDSPQYELKRVE